MRYSSWTRHESIDVAEVINNKYDIPFIFLSSFDDEDTLDQALSHSPYGYIVKPFHDRSLITTIKTALSNHTKKQSLQKLNKTYVEELIEAPLSDQEFTILQLLLDGTSYQDIADAQFLSRDSIKYHADKLYVKLKVKSRGELAERLL
ncbi:MAG: DNA-binding NarL/FixJ family response regulator [Saprospiraceae bacterium]